MKRQLMTAAAVCVLAFTAGCASTSAHNPEAASTQGQIQAGSGLKADYPATTAGANAFIAAAEARWAEITEYAARLRLRRSR